MKVTVLYNIADGEDVDAFERWRRTAHQQANASGDGVVATDFYIAQDVGLGHPAYRYVTESYFRDRASFEREFLDPACQAGIRADVERWKLKDFTVLTSEEVVSTRRDPST